MLQLYKAGSGSAEIQLVDREASEGWEGLRRNAIRFMRDAGEPEPAELMESLPFEMWSGTNSFGDEFHLLYLPTSPRAYLDFEKQLDEARDLWKYRAIADTLGKLRCYIRFIAVGVDMDGGVESVAAPELKITSDVVERALADAETLIRSSGAVSGLDRVHTALHGYLKAASQEAGLSIGNDPGITELFKLLRRSHPGLSGSVAGAKEIDRILNSMASIVDALNPLRNRGSVAHPNEELLDEPEAMLVINAVRTLLHYLNSRLRV
jgi:Abortive infection C-terminus